MKFRSARVGSVAGALVLLAQGLAMLPANAAPDPALAWTQTDMTVSGYQGTVIDAPVEFTYSGTITNPRVKVAGQFADSVSVDLTKAQATTLGHAMATISVNLPATQTASYVDNLQLTVDGQPMPQPLHLTVTPKRLDPNAIPEDLGFPSASRITTLEGSSVVSDQLVVYTATGDPSPEQTIKRVASSISGYVVSALPGGGRYELRVPGSTMDQTLALRDQVAGMAGVSAASVDVLGQLFGTTNDPIWGSNNTDKNWALNQIDAPGAWDTANGSGVSVAVIDGGIDAKHPDLASRIAQDNEVSGSDLDHGTHVSGTICAQGNNGIGTTGVAWNCNLSMYGIQADSWTGHINLQQAFNRVVQIINLKPADSPKVVNISLGDETSFDCTSPTLTAKQRATYSDTLYNSNLMASLLKMRPDILWVFAAGNNGHDVACSAFGALGNRDDLPNVISVAASGINGDMPSYSDRGNGVTVAAPGGYSSITKSPVQGVYSTKPKSTCWFNNCSGYGYDSGTSMAAPHVSGTAALAFSANQALNPAEVKKCLVSGAQAGGKQIAGQPFSIINASATVKCATPPPTPDVLHGISNLAVSMGQSLALANNGLVYSWGSNSAGQLGLGTTVDATRPQWVTGLDSVTAVAVGSGASYALRADGSIWAWGDDSRGQLGDGATTNQSRPIKLAGLPAAKSIITGSSGNVFVTTVDGAVYAWGDNSWGQLGVGSSGGTVKTPTKLQTPTAIREVVPNYWTTYAIGTDGSVYAWGDNSSGQLGDGMRTNAYSPQQVPGVDSAKQLVSGGYMTTYVLRTDGSVVQWGKFGPDGQPITPHTVDTPAPIAQLAAGGDVVFARTTADRLFAWGSGYCGSLGTGQDGTVTTPTQITGGGIGQGLVMNVSTTYNGNTTYAVLSDGSVWAWGAGGDGEMGNGTTAACTSTPTKVSNLDIATQVYTAQGAFGNSAAAFAIQSDGSVWSWGLNYGSNLGGGYLMGNGALSPKRI